MVIKVCCSPSPMWDCGVAPTNFKKINHWLTLEMGEMQACEGSPRRVSTVATGSITSTHSDEFCLLPTGLTY